MRVKELKVPYCEEIERQKMPPSRRCHSPSKSNWLLLIARPTPHKNPWPHKLWCRQCGKRTNQHLKEFCFCAVYNQQSSINESGIYPCSYRKHQHTLNVLIVLYQQSNRGRNTTSLTDVGITGSESHYWQFTHTQRETMDSCQKQQDTINELLTIGTCCPTVNRKRLRAGNNYTPLYTGYSLLTTHYLRIRSYVKQCTILLSTLLSHTQLNAASSNYQQNIDNSK